MGHRVIDAIIENGQLKYVGEELPAGRIEVHLIYDTVEEEVTDQAVMDVLAETWGIYKDIDPDMEAKRLREEHTDPSYRRLVGCESVLGGSHG